MDNISYSFAIPVHNGENYISETIDSILCQSEEKIELFVLDNGSTDKTTEIVKSYDDSRIKLINYDFVDSLSESLNRCFKIQYSSPLFSIIHADDFIGKNFAEEAIKLASKNLDYGIFFTNAFIVDKNSLIKKSLINLFKFTFNFLHSKYIGKKGIFRIICFNTLIAPAAIYRTNEIGSYYKFKKGSVFLTDLYFWINYLNDGGKIKVYYKKLFFLRSHNIQKSNKFYNFHLRHKEYSDLEKYFKKEISNDLFLNLSFRINYFLNKIFLKFK